MIKKNKKYLVCTGDYKASGMRCMQITDKHARRSL